MRHELEDVVTHKGLAAAEDHDLEAGARDLLDHRLALGRRQLATVTLRRVLVAVLALEVAPVGCHPRYDHRLSSLVTD